MGDDPEGGATHHISNLMGGFNGSTQHYLEIYLQDFEGLNSFVMADSKETKPCLGLIEYSPGQRFFVKEYGLNQLKKCCVDRLSQHAKPVTCPCQNQLGGNAVYQAIGCLLFFLPYPEVNSGHFPRGLLVWHSPCPDRGRVPGR